MPTISRLTRCTLLLTLAAPLLAFAAPTFSQLDLQLGSSRVGVQQQGAALASGSGLLNYTTRANEVFGQVLGNNRSGVLGVTAGGSFAVMATDVILAAPLSVNGASAAPAGLSPRGGVAQSLGFMVGVNAAGGLNYFDPTLPFSTSSAPGLFSTGSDLLPFQVGNGQSLFGQDNGLGGGAATGLLGTTADGRLRLLRTDGAQGVGVGTMVSRDLGFAADGGLAEVAGFIAGINRQGSVNLYDPLLDLLFENVGPAGLFSDVSDLLALDFGPGIDTGLFDITGDIAGSRGVLGITDNGGLAYLRLDIVPANRASAAHAVLKTNIRLGLDRDSGLALRSGIVTALAAEPTATVPEPPSGLLAAVALVAAAQYRRPKTKPAGLAKRS